MDEEYAVFATDATAGILDLSETFYPEHHIIAHFSDLRTAQYACNIIVKKFWRFSRIFGVQFMLFTV